MDKNTVRILITTAAIVILRIIIKNIKKMIKSSTKSLEYCKLESQLNDYFNKLTPEEKEKFGKQQLIIAVLEDYEMEVNNGGLCQYFANSSGAGAPMISECLKEINAKQHKKHFDKFINENKIDVNNLEEFIVNDIDEFEEKNKSKPFDEFDSKFYELYREENLEVLITEYAEKSFSKIFPDMNKKIDIKKLDVAEFVKSMRK